MTLKKKTTSELGAVRIGGKKAYKVRIQEEKEANEEIKQFKVPPCVGHDFEKDDEDTSSL